jgi:hypothetical protein
MTGTAIFLGVFLAVVVTGWAWCRCRAWRAELRDKAAARQGEAARLDAVRRHPSRVPGLPRDGEPLTEAELSEYTGIMLRPVRDPRPRKDGSPPGGRGQDSSEEAR